MFYLLPFPSCPNFAVLFLVFGDLPGQVLCFLLPPSCVLPWLELQAGLGAAPAQPRWGGFGSSKHLQRASTPQKYVNRLCVQCHCREWCCHGLCEFQTEEIPWRLGAVWSWSRSLTDTRVSCQCLVLGLFVTNSEDFVVPFQDKVALCSWRAGGRKSFSL